MIGGAGNDTYLVDDTGDLIAENSGEGTDLVRASVSYTLAANVENLTLTGFVGHRRHRQRARQHAHRQQRREPAHRRRRATTPTSSTTPETWSWKRPAKAATSCCHR
jgi:hypothetical protein